jgi:hypothetical protein
VAEGEVIYVGMGKPERAYHHLKACFWERRSPFYNKLRKLIRENADISVEVVWETSTRRAAADKEIELIEIYGRRGGGGTLWNLAAGGQGCSLSGDALRRRNKAIKEALLNSPKIAAKRKPPKPKKAPYRMSADERERISRRMREANPMKNPEVVEKMRAAKTGRVASQETRRKMSEARRGKKHSIVTCPHCGKTGGATAMPRWHFSNCKDLKP